MFFFLKINALSIIKLWTYLCTYICISSSHCEFCLGQRLFPTPSITTMTVLFFAMYHHQTLMSHHSISTVFFFFFQLHFLSTGHQLAHFCSLLLFLLSMSHSLPYLSLLWYILFIPSIALSMDLCVILFCNIFANFHVSHLCIIAGIYIHYFKHIGKILFMSPFLLNAFQPIMSFDFIFIINVFLDFLQFFILYSYDLFWNITI